MIKFVIFKLFDSLNILRLLKNPINNILKHINKLMNQTPNKELFKNKMSI